MYTLGYSFRPWEDAKSIADGDSILRYIATTARDHGVDRHIRFHHRVVRAEWSSADARWTVEARADGHRRDRPAHVRLPLRVHRLLPLRRGLHARVRRASSASGAGSCTRSTGRRTSTTPGKRVVVIGSGATAVTLVPALAERAEHVTMLQRSPSYVVSLPARDPLADLAAPRPAGEARLLARALEERAVTTLFFQLSRRAPDGCVEAAHPPGRRGAAPARRRRRHPLQAARTTRGTSASASSPTATCSRRLRRRRASVVTDRDRDLHRDAAARSRRARSSRRTSSSPPPA